MRDRLEDPQLKKDVSAFIGQEAMHSKEHAAYNEYAEEHGVDLECLELRIKVLLENRQQGHHQETPVGGSPAPSSISPRPCVAQLLKREDLTIQMQSPKMYKLWMWHAIEENEHKNVAYDVYQKVYGGYFTRVLVMMLTTLMFFGVIGWFQLDLLRKDGQLFNWRSWKHGLGTLFGLRKGFFTRLLPPYLTTTGRASTPATTTPRNWRNTGRTNWPSPIEARLRQCRSVSTPGPAWRFLFERRTGYCTRKSLRFDYRS